MALRGTRVLLGQELKQLRAFEQAFRTIAEEKGYEEIVLPSIWEQQTFISKAGNEVLNQMYTFRDKGDRDICLLPEGTAPIIELYKNSWEASSPKPVRIYYMQRFYRYERPQAGRYREFWQFGIECLGPDPGQYFSEMIGLIQRFMSVVDVSYELATNVERGLNYYTNQTNCFEVRVNSLGAQKQVLGGGQYNCGIGFAVGMDRLVLLKQSNKK